MDGVQVHCRICSKDFSVCRKCWRGQSYCSPSCSKEARRLSRNESQKKYRESRKGKFKQSQHQDRFRSKKDNKKIVSDHSSKVEPLQLKSTPDLTICICCGSRISELIPLAMNKPFSIRRNLQI